VLIPEFIPSINIQSLLFIPKADLFCIQTVMYRRCT